MLWAMLWGLGALARPLLPECWAYLPLAPARAARGGGEHDGEALDTVDNQFVLDGELCRSRVHHHLEASSRGISAQRWRGRLWKEGLPGGVCAFRGRTCTPASISSRPLNSTEISPCTRYGEPCAVAERHAAVSAHA